MYCATTMEPWRRPLLWKLAMADLTELEAVCRAELAAAGADGS